MIPSFKFDGSLCLFSSYFQGSLPDYTKNYLEALSQHFDSTLFITNDKELAGDDLEFLESINSKSLCVENIGYDFGMYYTALQQVDIRSLQRLALINDSNLLVQSISNFFQWLDHRNLDFASMLDSHEIKYHLKSDFLVFQNDALSLVPDYFKKNGVRKSKKKVIKKYEVGLSQYFLKKGLQIESFFKVEAYEKGYSRNPSFYLLERLVEDGFPLVKKKILMGGFDKKDEEYLRKNGFSFDREKHLPLIKSMNPTFEPPNS